MSQTVLTDSNVYIHLLRSGRDPVKVLGDWIGSGDLALCGMIRLEVERGIKSVPVREKLARFFDVMVNIPSTEPIWTASTNLAWSLDRKGIILPGPDLLIAASAASIRAAVLTDDKHFQDIPGCVTLDPSEELKPC